MVDEDDLEGLPVPYVEIKRGELDEVLSFSIVFNVVFFQPCIDLLLPCCRSRSDVNFQLSVDREAENPFECESRKNTVDGCGIVHGPYECG